MKKWNETVKCHKLFIIIIVQQLFEMRTTFCEIRLFNDTSQKHDTSFILIGEEWGGGKLEGVRENGKSVGGGV